MLLTEAITAALEVARVPLLRAVQHGEQVPLIKASMVEVLLVRQTSAVVVVVVLGRLVRTRAAQQETAATAWHRR
jgi:hypothetical protein